MTAEQITFIDQVGTAAKKYYNEYKILPSLVIAMAIKESGWGKSQLAAKNHNYFGMKWNTKCGTAWVEYNTKEYDKSTGKYVTVKAKFRSYDSMEAGIKGFYDFISGYKRYFNLIGETNPKEACAKIAADGWATAPNYGTSLYNDYIVKYNLVIYDVVGTGSVPDTDVKPYYRVGQVYTTDVNLYIRETPSGIKKKMYQLTVNAKLNSYQDQYGDAILKTGTRVTCKDVVHDGKSVWIEIPSGYICAVTSSGKIYVK